MVRILMIIITSLIVAVILVRNMNNKGIYKLIIENIDDINKQYVNLYKESSTISKLIQWGLIILAQIFMSINIIIAVWRYIDTYLISTIDIFIKILVILVFMIIIYLAVGYMLLTTSRIYKVLYDVENESIKIDLILSYFLLSMYFTILILFPVEFKNNYRIGIIGGSICYILNLRVLIKVIKNPQHIRSKNEERVSSTSVTIVAILIMIMIILNLFLAVCFISDISPDMYKGYNNNFDLFYYTIITFTTVGYGDIVPISRIAKVMSIIISSTSVICITIFLSSVLAYKDNE